MAGRVKKEKAKPKPTAADLEYFEAMLRKREETDAMLVRYRDANRIEFFDTEPNPGPNPLQAELLEAWEDPELKVFTYCGGNRIGKCLTKTTTCETPSGEIAIGELFENQKPFDVWAWDGRQRVVARASVPFKKNGLHQCYKIILSNGDVVEAADNHKILTSYGWLSTRVLFHKFLPILRESNLEFFPTIRPQDVRHLSGIATSSQFDCLEYPDLYCDTPFYVIGDNKIIDIESIVTRQEVYDFCVPKYHNYFAGGLVHHNTTIGVLIALSTMFGKMLWNGKKLHFRHTFPRKVRIVGQDWEKHIKSVLMPELEKWWPENRPVKRKKNNQGIDAFWTDEKTGSTLEIMSNGQESDLHEGWSGDVIVYDEPPKRAIRVANARGLIDRHGRELFCMTLLKEAWVHREVIQKTLDDGRPDPTIFNISGDIWSNVGFGITEEGVRQFESMLTDDEKSARLHGIPSYMSGLVYPQFSRKYRDRGGHLVRRFDIPLDWLVDIAIDVHPREKQAILCVATDPRGERYVCGEVWDHGDAKWVGEAVVRLVKYNSYRVNRAIIDPLSKGDGNNDESVFEIVSRILMGYGIVLELATKDKDQGILEVKKHLLGPNGMPSMWFFDDLRRTIFEIEGYMWDKDTQKPMDKDDHMMENLYRVCLLNTVWREPFDYSDDEYVVPPAYMVGRDAVTGY